MNDENKQYLDNLPLKLLTLAVQASKFPGITVTAKEIQGHPGFRFDFPPDHTDHDSTFHAPHPYEYEIHVLSAKFYVDQVEKELEEYAARETAHQKELARGKQLLATMTQADLAALRLVWPNES